MRQCLKCSKAVKPSGSIYCSNRCQADYKYINYIDRWKRGEVRGDRGINAKNISGHILRYLREKYINGCSICGWDKVNPTTGKIPLEIDHINGGSENNTEDNLRLICPNCHSLTSSYRNLNKGNGRRWRREKYVKVIPY